MTSDKLSSLTRTAPVLSLLLVATILFAWPLATTLQTAAAATTTTLTPEEEDVKETQETATENLTEEDREVNGIEFTPRWGEISTIEPDSIDILFADCLEDEFAVSSQFIFETSDIIASQSFPVAFADDDGNTAMTWLAVVENTHSTDDKAASIGVICASENDLDDDDDDGDIDVRTKTTINDIVKKFIRVENNQIVNLNNIINIRQQIIQNAIQILSITGNNNTVNQVINQAATQIENVNATTPTEIQQIIDQNAQQQGVIPGTGNQTSLSQLIEQDAAQQANVTEEEVEETITPPANETTIAEPLTASFTIDSTNGDTAPATFLFEAEDAEGGIEPYTYSWDFGDGQQGNEQFITHTFENPGTYTVILTVTDSAGQTATDTEQVTVQPPSPLTSVEIIPSGTEGVAPATFEFAADINREETRGYTFSWDFGDGQQGSGEIVTHTFENPGTYTVTVTVAHPTTGQTVTDTEQVTVQPSTTEGQQPPTTNETTTG